MKDKRKRVLSALCLLSYTTQLTPDRPGNCDNPWLAQRQPGIVSHLLTATAIRMKRPITDGFINDNIAIADLDVVQASWVRTDPGFVLYGSSLAAKIRKRNQITFTTLATPRKCILHEIASFLLSRGLYSPT